MFATAEGPFSLNSHLTQSLFFARQPEPDLEFTEEELEQTSNIRSPSPMRSPTKKPGKSPLLWVFLLILIGGGAYIAMEPEIVMDLVEPFLGETPEPAPPIAKKPPLPKPPAQSLPPAEPAPSTPASAAPTVEPPPTTMPAPPPAPAAVPEPNLIPAASVPPPDTHPPSIAPDQEAAIAPPAALLPNPLFSEGERVTLLPNPEAPRDKVALFQDAAGTKPGPAVPPGTVFTILDGDLQDRGWMYYVRSDYGTKGWLEEKQLRAKR